MTAVTETLQKPGLLSRIIAGRPRGLAGLSATILVVFFCAGLLAPVAANLANPNAGSGAA